jgi:hypothetical protein
VAVKKVSSAKPNVRRQKVGSKLKVLLDRELSVKKLAEKLQVKPSKKPSVPSTPHTEIPSNSSEI